MTELPAPRLHIDHRVITDIESAELSIGVATEAWAVQRKSLFGQPIHAWLYGPDYTHAWWDLSISVDEHSGEDAEPAPDLSLPLDGLAFPADLADITGLRLTESDQVETEAFYGNDAPALTQNRLKIGDWLDEQHLMVHWSAEYNWGGNRPEVIPFLYEGPVRFTGIQMTVKKDEDAPVLLSHALPRLALSGLDMILGREFVYDRKSGLSPDRRRWREVSWQRKPRPV
ncbi:hypothetical protein ABAC460_03570 [Asticcacaulis sp. AC460]|uniref:hypothetical protein n=1 Tax=Asticcacaulis sp. AC460 TaxID=1282360 RepID=UPI0003C3B8FD|nr:hypothetical protein [Asticcacaulis sp. AC460]ESQ91988.1 hypothetical protein ABAC460_03570 [Asticcacaulis sp. AC460]